MDAQSFKKHGMMRWQGPTQRELASHPSKLPITSLEDQWKAARRNPVLWKPSIRDQVRSFCPSCKITQRRGQRPKVKTRAYSWTRQLEPLLPWICHHQEITERMSTSSGRFESRHKQVRGSMIKRRKGLHHQVGLSNVQSQPIRIAHALLTRVYVVLLSGRNHPMSIIISWSLFIYLMVGNMVGWVCGILGNHNLI